MALKIKKERIIGTIDKLEDKLDGKLPVNRLELIYLVNSWGRTNFSYTQYLDEDIYIESCEAKECYDLSKLDVSEITNMEDLFSYSDFTNIHSTNGVGLYNCDTSNWNVSNVTSMNKMFYEAKNFNSPLNSWDTSNLFSMYSIFTYSNFNQNINSWDVSKVTDMGYAFCNTENFNQPLNKWNTSNVINMIGMFGNSIFNQDISNWNVSNVKNMSYMFYSSNFNQNISSWNTSKVTNMNSMLYNAKFFNQNISKWNFDKVNYCDYMFDMAESFINKYNSGETLPLDTKEIKEWLINNKERMNMISIKDQHGKEIDDFFSSFSNKEFSKEI